MQTKPKYVLVLVTAPERKTARRLAKAALQARLVACVNLVAKIESHYWWQGKLTAGVEWLMICKTTTRRVAAFEKLIIAEHSYDTPEFVVLAITRGNRRYLDWLRQSVSGK